MPAEREIGFGMLAIRVVERCERYWRVSEIVEVGRCARARTSDSMAATGMVRSGSERRRDWYVETMSKSSSFVEEEGGGGGGGGGGGFAGSTAILGGCLGEFVDGRKEGLAGENPRLWISVDGPLHSFSGVSVLTIKKKKSGSGPKRRGLLARLPVERAVRAPKQPFMTSYLASVPGISQTILSSK